MSSVNPSTRSSQVDAAVPIVPSATDFDPELESKVLEITRSCFPGPLEVEDNCDPEEPERRWRAMVVNARSTPGETERARTAWHRQMCQEFEPDQRLRYTIFVESPDT
jgi:hypothetical protein